MESRSIFETLLYVSDVIWWYCSRLNDEFPEPGQDCPREPITRIDYMTEVDREFLKGIPTNERDKVVIPQKYATHDAQEAWTMGKVLRRQAEHILEHRLELFEILQDRKAP